MILTPIRQKASSAMVVLNIHFRIRRILRINSVIIKENWSNSYRYISVLMVCEQAKSHNSDKVKTHFSSAVRQRKRQRYRLMGSHNILVRVVGHFFDDSGGMDWFRAPVEWSREV